MDDLETTQGPDPWIDMELGPVVVVVVVLAAVRRACTQRATARGPSECIARAVALLTTSHHQRPRGLGMLLG